MHQIFLSLNHALTFYCVFPLIVGLGIFFTIKLKSLQIRKMGAGFRSLLSSDKEGSGNISSYEAVAAVVAGNLGTGNISGMAVALTTGGPGALVWMWGMAFLGSIIQYGSCVLGAKYRYVNAEGEYVGGPMYYLSKGLKLKRLAACFSFFTLIAALAVGNFAQVNSIVLPLESMGFNPLLCGIVIAGLVSLVVLGGVQRIAKVAASVVPLMALLYLGTGVVILALHIDAVLPALGIMIKSAFQGSAAVGGVMGFTVIKALSTGFERGIFATDAGTGIVPVLQSCAGTKDAVTNGIATLVAPFLVMIVCTITGLILIVTGAYGEPGLASTNMVVFAFGKVFGSVAGTGIVFAALLLFAYTTIIAWGGCAEKAAEFLWNKKKVKVFQYLYLALVPVGAVIKVDFVWIFADLSIFLMLVTNLIGIIGLRKEIIAETKRYFSPVPVPVKIDKDR